MTRLLFALPLLLGAASAASAQTTAPAPADSVQRPTWGVGVVAGATASSMLGRDASATYSASYQWGFHAALTADFRFAEHLTLHPELGYTQKGSEFEDARRNRDLAYLDVPVLVRFHPVLEPAHASLYLEAGPQYSLLLTAKDADGNATKSEFRTHALGFAMGAGYRLANGLLLGARYAFDITNTYAVVPASQSLGRGDFQQNGRNDVFMLSVGYSLLK